MSVPSASSSSCGLPWCTTPHGRTTHPDDEDHRSVGILVAATVRDERGVVDTQLEVGLLRRRDEDTTWFVIEDGEAVHLELTLESARRVRDAVRSDETVRRALGLA